MDTFNQLRAVDLFSKLSDDVLQQVSGIATEARYQSGQGVYQSGAAGDALYVITQGKVAVLVKDDAGDEVEVATLKAGSYFGEMEVIGGMTRTAGIVAKDDCRLFRFDASELKRLLKSSDALAARFYEHVCGELIRRLRDTTRDMGYFKARSV